MKKKNLLVTLAILIAIGLAACASLAKLLAVTDEKVTSVETKAPLERQYTAFGPHTPTVHKWSAGDDTLKTFTVYSPQTSGSYPLVVMLNGSGTPVSRYEPVLKHLASWGFVVIGNEEEHSWSGQGASRALDFALAQNRDKSSPLYRKIDENKIGVAGHSQGGVGAINLATRHANSRLIRSVYTASTTKHELAEVLKWPYTVADVQVPYFMTAGAHESDAGDGVDRTKGIAPLFSMQENYAQLRGPAVLARRRATDHGAMLYSAGGYMAAWFLYTLSNDRQAAQVFTGAQAEIRRNTNWQDVEVKNLR